VFSGSKFQSDIYPVIRDFISKSIDEPAEVKAKARRAKSLRPGKGHHAFEGTEFADMPLV
jgi:hypothetical protein